MRKSSGAAVLTVASVTYALKGQTVLDGGGVPSRVVRPDSASGCAYGLAVDRRDLARAKSLLGRGGVPYKIQ